MAISLSQLDKRVKFLEDSFMPTPSTTKLEYNSKQYIVPSGDATVKVLAKTVIAVGEVVFNITSDTNISSSNLDTGSFTVGKNYYIYCCNSGGSPVFKVSLNSTYPSGFNATNSRKIGGFHYGHQRRFNKTTIEPINTSGVVWGSGWEDNIYTGILPFSVWTLLHRPKCSPEGMVWCEPINKWVDIYICNTNNKSEYNTTPMTGSEGLMYYDWVEKIARATGKYPLSYLQFCCVADGSPNGRDGDNNYAWSKTSNTGRNPTGVIAKAVSCYGLKDCSGNVWEVGTEISFSTQGSWAWRNKNEVKKGAWYASNNNDVDISLHGGFWLFGSYCGSRTLYCSSYVFRVSSDVGCRLSCDPM